MRHIPVNKDAQLRRDIPVDHEASWADNLRITRLRTIGSKN